jgi:hypothetical protein
MGRGVKEAHPITIARHANKKASQILCILGDIKKSPVLSVFA